MKKRDYYEILGIDKNSKTSEIKKAYRRIAIKYHPDKNRDSKSEKRFKVITEAYHFLKNQNKQSSSKKSEKTQDETDYTQTSQRFYKKTKWGEEKTPEADWGKYTKDFEANEEWWKRYENDFWEKYEKTIHQHIFKGCRLCRRPPALNYFNCFHSFLHVSNLCSSISIEFRALVG